jgi:cytochrome P450
MSAVTDLYYDPYDFAIDEDPYPVWRRLRDEAPLYYNERYDFYALSRFADVEAASVDWKTYSSARGSLLEMIRSGLPNPPGLFIGEDPPEHTMHRGILSRAVSPRRVAALEGRIRELCAELLDPFVGSDRFDLVADFAADLPMRVIGALVGIPEEFQEELREDLDDTARLEKEEPPEEMALPSFGEPYRPFLEFRRRNPADDFLTALIEARFTDVLTDEERGLSDAEILNYVGMLYAAGNETTARLIGWMGRVLAEHADQRAEVVGDRAFLANAVEETLRYEAPSPIQARTLTRDVELHDETVPAGSIVVLLTASANRDDRKFERADAFDLHRSIDHHLTFGYGTHYCFGAALARIEGRLALEELLDRFPTWDVDLAGAEMLHSSTIRGYVKLPIVLGA